MGRRERRARGVRSLGPSALAVVGLALLLADPVAASLGQWRQHAAAVVLDREVSVYESALTGAYALLSDPYEDGVVAFERGARPAARPPSDAAPTIPDKPPPVGIGSSEGSSPLRIRIPDIGLDQAVVEGVSTDVLRDGPGHYPGTALPGQDGNVVISGHRTTYTRPFYGLDALDPGDLVFLDTAGGTFTYRVARTLVAGLDDTGPLAPTGYAKLTLTTCNPIGSARERLVVEALLVA